VTAMAPRGLKGATSWGPDGHAGRVVLRDLRALVRLGVGEAERSAPQPVRLTLSLGVDVRLAGQADRLERAVDYGLVAEVVVGLLASGEWRLLEGLALSVAEAVLERFGAVAWVEVEATKVRPPVPVDLAEVAVVLSVDREERSVAPRRASGGRGPS